MQASEDVIRVQLLTQVLMPAWGRVESHRLLNSNQLLISAAGLLTGWGFAH